MNKTTAAAVVCMLLASGCQMAEPVPEYDGRNLYLGYCASCHGPTGAGDGPVAPSLAFRMADLRTLSQRHSGFPRQRLEEVIDGRTLRAVHGTQDMPVWGWEFRRVEPSEPYVAARIDALLNYLESIQAAPI
jgi:mono/diheme cytochrome c family protein